MVHPVVIIGSGLAGYTVARTLRIYDKETPLVVITQDTGEFYHKPMLSAGLKREVEALVSTSASDMADTLQATILTQTTVLKLNLTKRACQMENETIVYRDCVLACGAIPNSLLLPGASSRVLSVNSLQDYRDFRQRLSSGSRVVIVGSGLVGTEFATDLIQHGHKVSVISLEAPLSNILPVDLSQCLQDTLHKAGVSWYINDPIVSVEVQSGADCLELLSGERLKADVILSAIGLRSNLDLAQQAGLTVDQGVVVDRYGQTSDAHVYSVGDCAQVSGHVMRYVAPLRHLAEALGKTLAGDKTQVAYPAMPILVKTPLCPVVVAPPPKDCVGQWSVQGDCPDLQARFLDEDGKLCGFALMGTAVSQRSQLAKFLPPLLA